MTYGVKIAKPGKSVHSADLRDLSVDLNTFSMFKLHSNITTSVTLNGGQTEKSTTINHGLGYVPAFLVYYKRSDESVERLIPDIPYGVDFDFYPWAYATNTGIVVGYSYKQQYGLEVLKSTFDTCYTQMAGGTNAFVGVGKLSGGGSYMSGFQYQNVAVSNSISIVSATLAFKCSDGDDPPGNDTKIRTYGIDVDNCGDFGSDLGLSRTSAYTDQDVPTITDGTYFGIDVTNQFREITTRAGWSTGNDMGFYVEDNGTSSSDLPTYKSTYGENIIELSIIKSGSLTVSFRVIIFKDKIAD